MPRQQAIGKPTTRRYSPEEKSAAVRMVRTLRAELGTEHGTVQRVASQLGYGVESVRTWVKQADIDDGVAPGVSTSEAAYPGIYLHAGLLNDFPYPVCGCDACDSNWEREADDLERHVLAVVAGRYRETIERRESDAWIGHAFTFPDGATSGGSREPGIPPDQVVAAARLLRRRRSSSYRGFVWRRPAGRR